MANMKFNQLMSKKYPPPFVPNNETLNCDPTYELEEMIVEAKPLHKKKKRLMRQQSLLSNSPSSNNSIHGSDVSTYMTINLTNREHSARREQINPLCCSHFSLQLSAEGDYSNNKINSVS
jgi:hypothetical protein